MGHCDKLGMMINIWNTEIGKKVISPIMDTVSTDNTIWEIIHLNIMGNFFSRLMDLQWYLLKHIRHLASRETTKKIKYTKFSVSVI